MIIRTEFLKGMTLLTASSPFLAKVPPFGTFSHDLTSHCPTFKDIKNMIAYRITGDSPKHGYRSSHLEWYSRWLMVNRYIELYFQMYRRLPNGLHTIDHSFMIPNCMHVNFDEKLARVLDDWRHRDFNDYPDWLELKVVGEQS